jgi:hypothetical protein
MQQSLTRVCAFLHRCPGKVIDATLKVDTPHGPTWHRYQGDGYGEHADGHRSTAPVSAARGHS